MTKGQQSTACSMRNYMQGCCPHQNQKLHVMRKISLSAIGIALSLLLGMPVSSYASEEEGSKEKTLLQDSDSSKENFMKNRRALVGPGCVVNSLFDGVKVIGGVANLQNITDDDLSDYATIPSLADVGVTVEPIISVRDLDHYYASGTQVGFSFVASSGSSLLTLNISQFYRIWFYKNGEKVGEAAVEQGEDIKGINLSLIQIPGSDNCSKDIVATAPADFDEIMLVKAGVNVDALGAVNLKYAFVGKAREYTLTKSAEGGIADYNKDTGRNITVEGHGEPNDIANLPGSTAKLVDDDLTNGYTVQGYGLLGLIGSSLPATVKAKADDGEEPFKAGTEIGFRYNNTTGLDLGLANSTVLVLYDKDNKQIDDPINISTSVLGLDVVGKQDGAFLIKAPKDFSSAKILFPTLLNLNFGVVNVNYAFIRMAPDVSSHHCQINASADRAVCDCDNVYQLSSNPNVPVTWTVEEQPTGANATIDADGKVTLSVAGEYKFKATAADGCYEYSILNYGNIQPYEPETNGERLLVNTDNEEKYAISDATGGGLIQISTGVKNRKALVTPTLRDYSYLKVAVDVADSKVLGGVKSVDGSNLAEGFSGATKAGFVIATKATALSADVLNMFNIRLYKNGKEVENNLTKHWDAIAANLIGSGEMQKMRYSIDVPAGTDFDEIVLWKSGLLDANLSQFNIYYAFVENADETVPSENSLYKAQTISHETTDATIDYENTNVFSVANIGNGVDNISYVVDDDLSTGVDFPLGANLGGAKLAVNVGKTVSAGQQLVVVMNKVKVGLGVELGNALKVETYLNGEQQEELTSWKVLGADIIGDGGKTYAVLNTSKPFDQVRIMPMNVLGALTNIKLYGFALRNDANADGTPDAVDQEPCGKELVLNEEKTLDKTESMDNVRLVFRRTMTKNVWNSLVLPVSMDATQLKYAFGDGVKIAFFDRVDDNWIYFELENDNNLYLKENTPCIIYPTADPAIDSEGEYETVSDGVISGPLYFASGVSYTDQTANLSPVAPGDDADCNYYGSYKVNTEIPVGSYVFNKGDMVFTTSAHKQKAYRCYVSTPEVELDPDHEATMRSLRLTGNGTDDVRTITDTETADITDGNVYTLGGQRVDARHAKCGIYVMNGKKFIVK